MGHELTEVAEILRIKQSLVLDPPYGLEVAAEDLHFFVSVDIDDREGLVVFLGGLTRLFVGQSAGVDHLLAVLEFTRGELRLLW